jgi:lipoyl(octanoyl) transferase
VTLDVRRLGRVDYEPTRALQLELVEKRARGDAPDTLLLCEHPPVVTLGRGTRDAAVLLRDVPIVEIERGGEATYHGPGQLVGYWIRDLSAARRDLRGHLRLLEDVLIDALASFGVEGLRADDATGVWTRRNDGTLGKLASLGVAAKKWIAFHGFALNVSVDLANFARIRPCGFDASVMTSLHLVAPSRPSLDAAADAVAAAAARATAAPRPD